MKTMIGAALCMSLALLSGPAFAKGKSCAFADTAKLTEHLQNHVTYPAKGKAIKEACKKEMPDEFTASEKSCVAKKLKDNVEYKDADEVLKALGVGKTDKNPAPAR